MDKEIVQHEQRRRESFWDMRYCSFGRQGSRSLLMVKAFSEMGGTDSIINMQGMYGGEEPNSRRLELLDKPHGPILIR